MTPSSTPSPEAPNDARNRPPMTLRARISESLDEGMLSGWRHALIARSMVALILVSIWCVIQSTDETTPALAAACRAIDRFAIAVFAVEYCLRLWTCPDDIRYRRDSATAARRAYLLSIQGVIDLIAALPGLLMVLFPAQPPFIVAIELLRCAKMLRYSTSLQALVDTILRERAAVLAAMAVIAGIATMAGGLIYALESPGQPKDFDNVLTSIWWAVESIVGSSTDELSPETAVGRLLAALLTIFGFLMLALPVGIVGASFENSFRQKDFTVSAGLVARVGLFARFRPEEIVAIASALQSRKCAKGDVIIRKGDVGKEMYFIVAGRVGVETGHGTLALERNAYFGERALIRTEPRNSTVTAMESTRLLVLDKAVLFDLIERRPDIADELKETIGARERPAPPTS